jgi:hypothetical protein
VKIFISSVRRGLEQERDALPGMIAAIGHEPLRFEDFTAQSIPSREACVRGVQQADVYILIAGEHYGQPFDDTGQSPTHDEWSAAVAAGIQRLVYVKRGVSFDPDQRAFLDRIEAYEHGVFRDSYTEPTDLLTKVAARLRELANAPGPLLLEPLEVPIAVDWLSSEKAWAPSAAGIIEVHAIPSVSTSRSARRMRAFSESLPARLRASPLVGQSRAVIPSRDSTGVTVSFPHERRGGGQRGIRPAELLGVRVSEAGQASAWASLPGDDIGGVIEPATVGVLIADLLRVLGSTGACEPGPLAIAVGVYEPMLVSVDSLAGGARSRASLGLRGEHAHVVPDEVVSSSAVHDGAGEMGSLLAAALIEAFQGPHP